MTDRRAEAVAALQALGATFAQGGDVAALRARIDRRRSRRRRVQVFNPLGQCHGKFRHASPEAARTIAKRLGLHLQQYHCPHCGSYHNGNPPKV